MFHYMERRSPLPSLAVPCGQHATVGGWIGQGLFGVVTIVRVDVSALGGVEPLAMIPWQTGVPPPSGAVRPPRVRSPRARFNVHFGDAFLLCGLNHFTRRISQVLGGASRPAEHLLIGNRANRAIFSNGVRPHEELAGFLINKAIGRSAAAASGPEPRLSESSCSVVRKAATPWPSREKSGKSCISGRNFMRSSSMPL